jgi:hypothetical protein
MSSEEPGKQKLPDARIGPKQSQENGAEKEPPTGLLGQPYTTDFRPSIRVFTGLTIVGCGSTLWLARNEGRFLSAPTSTLRCGPSTICPEGFLLSSDEARDKRRLQKLLILEAKLMSALGTERTNQQSRNET